MKFKGNLLENGSLTSDRQEHAEKIQEHAEKIQEHAEKIQDPLADNLQAQLMALVDKMQAQFKPLADDFQDQMESGHLGTCPSCPVGNLNMIA
uniref:Uncharacterized protein n=1 Tax=Oncorhynchus kisutch TaxID=8019 RepID=A0A8C7M2I6_ONCKI